MSDIRLPFNGGTAILTVGGPTHKMFLGGKTILFEDHHWCGPTAIRNDGEPLKHQSAAFLKAASLWAQQGKKLFEGWAEWETQPKEIIKHMGGRHYKVVGYTKPEKQGGKP